MNIDKLRMVNISMEFPGVKALSNVDFSVGKGEVHALIGANGAGKSTLMKVLGGVNKGFSGEIFIGENKLNINNTHEAKKEGIVVVYQEVDTALISNLTVAENIMLDYIVNDQKSFFMNWKHIRKQARESIKKLGMNIDVNKLISELTLSEKQMVLIGRAVFQNAKYLILDEPTAPLSIEETKKLFKIVRTLRDSGVTIIFISHRLDEIFEICDRITILRDGFLVGEYDLKDLTMSSVVEKMLGKKLENTLPKLDVKIGDIQVKVENLSDNKLIKDINFNVRSGEIIGLSGLVGAGKTELCRLLFGADKIHTGTIKLNGIDITPKSSVQAVKNKMALVPEERRRDGILVHENIETNLTLPTLEKYCKATFMDKKKIKSKAKEVIDLIGIKTPSETQKVANLSGGNQQKVAIGKWIISDADIYIFDEPTKGVDVGSKSDIYLLIGELAKRGKSIIYATCEYAEILGITDRTFVMYDGRIIKKLVTKDTSEEELLYYSIGGTNYEKQN